MIIVAAILAGCAVASVFMPAYWYMVADAIPQSLSVPSTIRRSSLVFWDRTGATAMVSMMYGQDTMHHDELYRCALLLKTELTELCPASRTSDDDSNLFHYTV